MLSQKPSGPSANRQKIIIGGIVVGLIVVLWQIKGMFGGGSKPAVPPPQSAPQVQQMQARPVAPGQPAQPLAANPNQPVVSSAQPQISEAPVPKEVTGILMTQQQMQQHYLESLNELQMLRLQRELIELKGAIASAELAKATTEKNLQDLLNPPPPPPPPPHMNPYLNNAPPGPGAAVEVESIWSQYRVLSVVSNEAATWSAVIGFRDKTFVVNVGDVLPPDGSRVISINKQGVTIENDGKTKQIEIISSSL